MLRPIMTERRIIILGIVVTVVVMLVSIITIRATAVYRLTTEQALLQSQFTLLKADLTTKYEGLEDRVMVLEQTYTSPTPTSTVIPPALARRQSSLEQWIYNRDKELNARVQALERARYRDR